jgi:Astacin (Peptidase family M12A)
MNCKHIYLVILPFKLHFSRFLFRVKLMTSLIKITLARAIFSLLVCWSFSVSSAEGERSRVFWNNALINSVERNGMAIAEGDIVVGSASRVLKSPDNALLNESGRSSKALIAPGVSTWPRSASGVVEIPYVFEAGSKVDVDRAVMAFNDTFNGLIRWVPKGAQADYVVFRLTDEPGGACYSAVGRSGGRQDISGNSLCPAGRLLHEMGHVIGLLHTQNDPAADKFVETYSDRISPAFRFASQPIDNAQRIGGYDYRSIMHYGRQQFSMLADPITIQTKPFGIDIGVRDEFSLGDIDAVKRLYGSASTATTIGTNPPGLRVRVDGQEYQTPVQFNWAMDSTHQLDVVSDLQTLNGFTFAFGRWSHDASESPGKSIAWTVAPAEQLPGQSVAIPKTTVLIANFIRLIAVASDSSAATGGSFTVTPERAPWPGTSNLYPNYTKFTIAAQAQGGRQPEWIWNSPLTINGGMGGAPSATFRLTEAAPLQELGARFVDAPGLLFAGAGPGIDGNISAQLTTPDGTEKNVQLPLVRPTSGGTYRLRVESPQAHGEGVRYVLDGINGLDDPVNGQVTAPLSREFKTVTVRMRKQLQTVTERSPSCAGSLTLSDASDWHSFGQQITATASANPGAKFAGWRGSVSGLNAVATMTVGDAIPEFIAQFNTIEEPLTLTAISVSRGSATNSWIIDVRGSGITSSTRIAIGSKQFSLDVADSHSARVMIASADFNTPDGASAYLYHSLGTSCNVYSELQNIKTTELVDYGDMWWVGPEQNGWGVSITQHRDVQFVVIFAYDAQGKPVWYVLSGGTWDSNRTAYSGALYVPTSSAFSAYRADKFMINAPVGDATIRYENSSVATISYTINGVSDSKKIKRQIFGAQDSQPSLDVKDIWWGGPSENGWGLNIAQQGKQLFLAWYTYDTAGKVTWFVVSGGTWNGSTFTGAIYSTTSSPWLGVPYDPTRFLVTPVGEMSLAFDGADKANMTYTVSGVTQSKSITRLAF